jgi:peptide deformylase
MSHLPIKLFPDPILRKPAEKVTVFDAALLQIIKKMDQTMRLQASGIGIAAPQVGISRRIALVDVSARVPGTHRRVVINPQILELKEEKISREGCMSLPDYLANIKRYDWIRAIWQDETGKAFEETLMGIEAVCFQHETDHLNGKLFIDRVALLKRDLIPRTKKSH